MKELRMYSLVLYQLSGIQAGIQAGHSWVEYGEKCKDKKLYKDWAENHKTVMVMNGGSTIMLNDYKKYLESLDVDCVGFKEPDLGGLTTAISFIISDDVFNLEENINFESFDVKNDLLNRFLKRLRFHGGR